MATYDLTTGGAAIPWDQIGGDLFTLTKRLVVVTEVARFAVPTAATYFATDDVLELIDFPIGCRFMWTHFRTITAGTGSGTADLGLNGGQEFDAAVAMDATAGTVVIASVNATQGTIGAAADTADLEVLTQNMDTADLGDYEWTLVGLFRP